MKRKILFSMIRGMVTTGAISLLVLAINVNLPGLIFLKVWLKSWGVAYLVAIPCILFIGPPIERMVDFPFIKNGNPYGK